MAFKGKVVLITGGGSGMGQLAAQNFARDGKQVAIFDINQAGLDTTTEGFDNITSWVVDITKFEQVNAAVADVEAQLGPIDRCYNCAAIMPFGKLAEQDNAIAHKIVEINYGGLINITQAVIPRMTERKRGEFVSFASMAGIVPTVLTGVYSASKAAVDFHNEILHHEVRDLGVKVVSVCPPMVNTPLLQQGRDTVWPKMLESQGDAITPQEVLDAVEAGLAANTFRIFPGKGTRIGQIMRRLFPNLIWKQVHKVEGF